MLAGPWCIATQKKTNEELIRRKIHKIGICRCLPTENYKQLIGLIMGLFGL